MKMNQPERAVPLQKMRFLVTILSVVLIGLQALDTAVLLQKSLFTETSCCDELNGSCCESEDACADFCCRAAMSLQLHSIDHPKKEKSTLCFQSSRVVFNQPQTPHILTGYYSIPKQPPKCC